MRNYVGNLIDYKVRAGDDGGNPGTPNTEAFGEGEELRLSINGAY